MTEPRTCKKCGVLISKATAFNNRGRCAACNHSPEVKLRNDVIGTAFAAVVFAAGGGALFLLYGAMEITEKRIRMPIILIPVYKAFGPVGMGALPILVAGGMVWLHFVKRKELREFLSREESGEDEAGNDDASL